MWKKKYCFLKSKLRAEYIYNPNTQEAETSLSTWCIQARQGFGEIMSKKKKSKNKTTTNKISKTRSGEKSTHKQNSNKIRRKSIHKQSSTTVDQEFINVSEHWHLHTKPGKGTDVHTLGKRSTSLSYTLAQVCLHTNNGQTKVTKIPRNTFQKGFQTFICQKV